MSATMESHRFLEYYERFYPGGIPERIASEANVTSLFHNCSRNIFYISNCFMPFNASLKMKQDWHLPVVIVTTYLFSIYTLQKYMENRKPFDLQRALTIWNGTLALFSIMGTIRLFPEFVSYLKHYGLFRLICQIFYEDRTVSFWLWLHVLSKIAELGDTLFIVLRKRKLIFLHWYHHVTVLLFSWLCYSQLNDVGTVYSMVNYIVHSLMYTYFTLSSMKMRVPTLFVKALTLCQILQMFAGCYVTSLVIHAKMNAVPCNVTGSLCIAALAMYISYLILFIDFFCKKYLVKCKRAAAFTNFIAMKDTKTH